MFLRVLLVIAVSVLFVVIYVKAAGTLSLRKLSFVSLAFFYFLVFAFVGISLFFLGYREHYLLVYVSDSSVYGLSYFLAVYSILVFGIVWVCVERLAGLRNGCEDYRTKQICFSTCNEEIVLYLVFLLMLVSAGALIYTFACYGGIPIIDQLKGKALDTVRNDIGRNFSGNQYVRNLLALTMTPALSYLAYIYMRTTHKPAWKLLFVLLFILSVFCKTYNLEKSPLIFYLFFLYYIECLLGNVRNRRGLWLVGLAGGVLLLVAYKLAGYSGEIFTLSSGPLSRLLLTQIATLLLHVQVFPGQHEFLAGESFAPIFGGSNLRSGSVVMEHFRPQQVAEGTAGVMNTLFIGEAYANYGIAGAIIAPVLVGAITSCVFVYLMKHTKDPINLTIYVLLSSAYSTALIGGYTDFFYSFSSIFVVAILVIIKLLASGGRFFVRKTE